MELLTKLTLTLLFFLCLLDMPYGFYELVRFIAMMGFAFLAYREIGQKENGIVWIYIALALLFQPFFKIALGRAIWNVVDIVIGLGLLASIPMGRRGRNKLP